ncbi:hypothetical protein VPNG_06135 [Cytospora leucostoma]|uniref:Uncharacterized protein n=1 Tax=Cytospora leucostoma TaxID=1230097 RepID=A0A423WX66_9PEZI|nr:hypothetical protein VPNG_06135 [Cytospora leucostoma]
MALDQDNLRRKNDELNQAYKDKSRKLLQTQELYDKLKRRAMLGQIQDAASDAVDTTLHGGVIRGVHQPYHVDVQDGYQQQFGTPMRPAHYAGNFDRSGIMPPPARMVTQDMREGTWDRQLPQQANIPVTPSTHRQRPGPDGFGISAVPGLVAGTPVALHGSGQLRQPPPEMQHNEHTSTDSFTGIGLSSRLKASQASGKNGTFVPAARPHVAQRSGAPALGVMRQTGIGPNIHPAV